MSPQLVTAVDVISSDPPITKPDSQQTTYNFIWATLEMILFYIFVFLKVLNSDNFIIILLQHINPREIYICF